MGSFRAEVLAEFLGERGTIQGRDKIVLPMVQTERRNIGVVYVRREVQLDDSGCPPGKKGPNTSHYHLDGKGNHYSPAPGDKDPGFNQ